MGSGVVNQNQPWEGPTGVTTPLAPINLSRVGGHPCISRCALVTLNTGRSWQGGEGAISPLRVLHHPFVSPLPAREGCTRGRSQRSQISMAAPINAISSFHAYELIDFFFFVVVTSVFM